jgi:hypothetical protein
MGTMATQEVDVNERLAWAFAERIFTFDEIDRSDERRLLCKLRDAMGIRTVTLAEAFERLEEADKHLAKKRRKTRKRAAT